MNTPTPDLVSQILSSAQTVSLIEEHDAVKPAVRSPHDISGSDSLRTTAIPANSAALSVATELHPRVPGVPTTDIPDVQGMRNESIAPLSNFKTDSRGLLSALAATSLDAPRHILHELPEIGHNLGTFVRAEDIGFVENLFLWLEERLGKSVVSQWGFAPGTKRVANLWSEFVEGESLLEDSRPPKRVTQVACVRIKNDKGDVLVEEYQEMTDGTRRQRHRPLSEKMKPGEGVEEACLRGISEELGNEMGARGRVVLFPDSYKRRQEERDSLSYPGLRTRYILHSLEAHIQQLPSTEFYTDEDEVDHAGPAVNVDRQQGTVTVKRHFWRWISEAEL